MAKRGSKSTPVRGNGAAHEPVYVTSLSVENVKCFGPKQTLNLTAENGGPARWTVILGGNGTGKTTLLEAIVSMELIELAFDGGSTSSLPRGFWNPIITQSYGISAPNTSLFIKHSTDELTIDLEISSGGVLSKWTIEESTRATMTLVSRSNGSGRYRPPHALKPERLSCFAYGAARRIGSTRLGRAHEEDHAATLFDEEAMLINAEEWLLQSDYVAAKAEDSPRRRKYATKKRDAVIRCLIDLLPEVDDIRIRLPEEKGLPPRAEFKCPYGWISLSQLSLGYRTLVGWVVDLAAGLFDRYPDSKNPLAEPAVVLIDELDLHLHPAWQRNIMQYLSERFINTQFIATAHSPLVVQGAEGANLVVLRREGDHVVIDNDPESVTGWRVDQILTSELFGLSSARSPSQEKVMVRRAALVAKSKRSAKDKRELEELNAEVLGWQEGETPDDRAALDFLQRAAKKLKDS